MWGIWNCTSSELYSGYFWLLYFLPRFSVAVLPRALRFWVAFFTHMRFLSYAPPPTFLEQFVTQMRAGTPHPGSCYAPALTELSLSAEACTWITHILVTRPLIYQWHQWTTKYRVKIKLLRFRHVLLITTSMNIKVILLIIENNRCLTDMRCF